jgi:phage N-6-adenine-methyltransferase
MIRNPGKKKLKGTDVRETPRPLYAELNAEFRFTLDAAATDDNALCERYFTEWGLCTPTRRTPIQGGGLSGTWAGERVWCNPPFTELLAWTDKAWEEQTDAHVIVMLVPSNRNDQPWWQKNVAPYVKKPGFDVRWFAERHRFTINGGQPILNSQGKVGSPSFSCALLIWS